MRVRARLVTTNFSQSLDGFWLVEVRISMVSPLRSG